MNDVQVKNHNKELQKCVKEIKGIINNANSPDKKEIIDSVTKVYGIYQKYTDLKLAEWCISTLERLTVLLKIFTIKEQQECTEELQDIVAKAYSIYKQFPNSEFIAEEYMVILEELALYQQNHGNLLDIVAEVHSIYKQFPNQGKIAEQYVFTLGAISTCPLLTEELQGIVVKARSVYKQFSERAIIASGYLGVLWNFVTEQEDFDELRKSFNEAYSIYQKFSEDENIALRCIFFLQELARKQEVLNEIQEIISKADEIYQHFQKSGDIANEYIMTMVQLAKKPGILDELQGTVKKVLEIYRSFSDRVSSNESSVELAYDRMAINESSAEFVYEYINSFFINPLKEEKDKIEDRFKFIRSELSNVNENEELIVTIIDQIFSSTNNFSPLTNREAQNINRVLRNFTNIDSLQHTKYAVLINLRRDLEEAGCRIEPLIKIYYMVQTIKFQLCMKDLSKVDFGHYTSGEVLQILLRQSSDEKKQYSIEGRTRLGNVKYMNDPEEGSVLDRYLESEKSNDLEVSLKPSPWFLMSLTTAIDDLAMWSQYGDGAEGVCLVFTPDSFEVPKSMVETEWMTKKSDISNPKRKLNSTIQDERSSSEQDERSSSDKKDFLYRVCYLDEKSLNNGDLTVFKKDNNTLDSTERKIINRCLKRIKSIVSSIEKNTLLYSAVEECLEEIRYLFKVSDYSYESELRILQYADLNPGNEKIKIDNSGHVAKLYLERDMPIQLEQVIFGPKFSNPEHVTPLLHLLDKNIEFKLSERKFK